jgi:hypothetical protein|tara:strand:- start:449 stop:679 length:231 start_codon:yes stop_codon:yes gene_type:complete
MVIEAIKSKNQGKVNRAVNWLVKFNEFDRLRNIADGDGNEREFNRLDKKCYNAWDKYGDALWHLPRYEEKQIQQYE